MRILFLGLNYAPEEIGVSKYTTGLCEDLVAEGHRLRVVAAQPYYPRWAVFPGYSGVWKRTQEKGVDLTRCPIYVPANPTGLKRLIHHASFAASSLGPMIKAAFEFKPDLVMTAAPSLIAAPVAWLAAKLSRAKCWLHIQDFEVEAAFATGLLDGSGSSARLAHLFERSVIRRFDVASSISPEMCNKLIQKRARPDAIIEFRNWADISRIFPLNDPSPYREEWGIRTDHVALYSGNIANKQGIEIVVEAAHKLRDRKDLTFVICGEGPNRETLQRHAAGLANVQFHDLQPVERLNDLLGLATIHLLPQKADAADLLLPSKLTNMLASGRPVVATALEHTGLAREVQGSGLVVPPGDVAGFADAILSLMDEPAEWRRFARNARSRAVTVWDRQMIIAGFVGKAEGLLSGIPQQDLYTVGGGSQG